MRVAVALLVDDELNNRLTRVTVQLREYGFGLRVLRLPPHVSLKQPFIVDDFARFELFFDYLAQRIEAQRLVFSGFQFWGDSNHGVVSLHVDASERLRSIHKSLNAELEEHFGDTPAEHDGDDYDFHLTVAIGACHERSLARLQTRLTTMSFDAQTVAAKLAMFIYEESPRPDALYGMREYGTYKVLPL